MFARLLSRQVVVILSGAFLLLTAAPSIQVAKAADKDATDKKETANKEVKVAGIVFDRKDNWVTVRADGEQEVLKYEVGAGSDKRLTQALNAIFNACRVQLTYKQQGDTRQLVSIKRQIFKEEGTITGNFVGMYNDFWIEVKPKTGVSDAYAPGANWNDKAFMEKLKSLKPGDNVTIRYYTDFERHRIVTLTINKRAEATSLDTGSPKTGTPAKK